MFRMGNVLDANLVYGVAAEFQLNQLVAAGDVSSTKKQKLLDCFRRYMIKITEYLCARLPLGDELLSVASWLDPTRVESLNVKKIVELAYRFVLQSFLVIDTYTHHKRLS